MIVFKQEIEFIFCKSKKMEILKLKIKIYEIKKSLENVNNSFEKVDFLKSFKLEYQSIR